MKEVPSKHRFDLRVYYADTDAGGVVYHARYVEFFERARFEAFVAFGLGLKDLADRGIGFAITEIHVRYKKPAVLGDVLTVESQITERTRTSFLVRQRVLRGTEELCAGEVRVVCLDSKWKPQEIPAEVLKHLPPL